VTTNGRFLHDLLGHPAFAGAAMHSNLIDEWAEQREPLLQRPAPDDAAWLVAATLRALPAGRAATRPAALAAWHLALSCQGETRALEVQPNGDAVGITMAGQRHQLRLLQRSGHRWRIELDGVQRSGLFCEDGAALHLAWQAASFVFTEPSPFPAADTAPDARRVLAPVAGTVTQVAVQPGDAVAEGQPLVCVEAMKMEMWQHAGAAGTVAAVHVAARSSVAAGALLVELTLNPPAGEKDQ
jgi:geranyl-CoA carboxylase alpha subunit